MVWYKELGFGNNPFSIKPGAFSAEIIGYDLSEVVKKIEESKVLFLEGEYGFGKTSILKHIIRQFGGKKKLAYYNCNRADETINVEGIIRGADGLFGRLMGLLPEGIILLLDEVEKLSEEDQKDLLKFYKEGNLKSIIFFGPNFDRISFLVELRKLMVNNVIKLTELTAEEAVQLVRERVGNLRILDDDIVRLVFKHSQNNPRIMLENLEDLVKSAVDNNEEKITVELMNEVLGVNEKIVAPKKEETPKPKAKPVKPAKPVPPAQSKKKAVPKPKKKAEPKPEKKAEPKAEEKEKEKQVAKAEKPKAVKPKAAKPKTKPAKPAPTPPKRNSKTPELDKEFESKPPTKKDGQMPPLNEELEEEDFSEPADDDDQGGEYYYYY
jgi:hypothetical protein